MISQNRFCNSIPLNIGNKSHTIVVDSESIIANTSLPKAFSIWLDCRNSFAWDDVFHAIIPYATVATRAITTANKYPVKLVPIISWTVIIPTSPRKFNQDPGCFRAPIRDLKIQENPAPRPLPILLDIVFPFSPYFGECLKFGIYIITLYI